MTRIEATASEDPSVLTERPLAAVLIADDEATSTSAPPIRPSTLRWRTATSAGEVGLDVRSPGRDRHQGSGPLLWPVGLGNALERSRWLLAASDR